MSGKPFVVDLNDEPEFQRLLGGEPQTCGMKAGRVYLASGESCGRHNTEEKEEMLIFLSGRGVVLIGEQRPAAYEVGQRKVFYIPPQTTHDVKNTATEPLIYIYCVAPTEGRGQK